MNLKSANSIGSRPGQGGGSRLLRRVAYRLLRRGNVAIRPLVWMLGVRLSGKYATEKFGRLRIRYGVASDIGHALFVSGSFEAAEIEVLCERMKRHPSPVIMDVGANIGVHTLCLADRIPSARFYAFEPNPESREVLSDNIRANRLQSRVVVRPEALADYSGTGSFYLCHDDAYSSLKDTHRKPLKQKCEVSVTTLDRFVKTEGVDAVTLVKIDVEGFEREVIRGASETIQRWHPELFVEIYGGHESNPDPEGTIKDIQAYGYQAFVIIDGRPVPFRGHDDGHYNYLFSRSEVV